MAGDWNNNRSRLQRLFNSRNSLPFSETCKVFFFSWVGGRNRLPPSPKCWRAGGRPRHFSALVHNSKILLQSLEQPTST